jgi:hypothetical protein
MVRHLMNFRSEEQEKEVAKQTGHINCPLEMIDTVPTCRAIPFL